MSFTTTLTVYHTIKYNSTSYFGYQLKQGGTGSGVKFIKAESNEVINFRKPHSSVILKRYVLDQVIEKLRKNGLL